jgi:hypothetical protein
MGTPISLSVQWDSWFRPIFGGFSKKRPFRDQKRAIFEWILTPKASPAQVRPIRIESGQGSIGGPIQLKMAIPGGSDPSKPGFGPRFTIWTLFLWVFRFPALFGGGTIKNHQKWVQLIKSGPKPLFWGFERSECHFLCIFDDSYRFLMVSNGFQRCLRVKTVRNH